MSKRRKNYGFVSENAKEETKDIPVVPNQGEQQASDTQTEEPKKGLIAKAKDGICAAGKKAVPVAKKVGKVVAFGAAIGLAFTLGKKSSSGGSDSVEDADVDEGDEDLSNESGSNDE